MIRAWKFLVVGALFLVAGCTSSEVYGVIGDEGDVFTGQMTGGTNGRIELDNGKGTRCVGDYAGRKSTAITVVKVLAAGMTGTIPSFSSSAGRALLTCSDGQQALVQFSSTGGESGYGFGTTRDGRPVRFTYGLSRDQSASYLHVPTTQAASTPGGPSGRSTLVATGTGFFITRQGHVLTNAHVVDGCKSLTIARVGEAATMASVVSVDKQNDLAVLMAASPAPAVAAFRGRPIRQGDAVVAFGFPYAGSLSSGGSVTAGSVNALSGLHDDTRYLQVSAPVQPGNSGGPLLDDTGAVVGVVSAVYRSNRATGIVPQNVNFAIKADIVRTFLGAAGVTPEAASTGRELSTPDIGERARAFSVLIDCMG
jgi:S1-C subfamily serine protease